MPLPVPNDAGKTDMVCDDLLFGKESSFIRQAELYLFPVVQRDADVFGIEFLRSPA